MIKLNNLSSSFISAVLVVIYVLAVSWLISHGEDIFGGEDTFIIPLFMLVLFIVSACITGSLVLGRPIIIYLNGQKKEAFQLFFSTLGWLVIFLLSVVIFLVIQA